MKQALVIVDVQKDFLDRPGLYPASGELTSKISILLELFRKNNLPVFHIHTVVDADGGNRMPHWKTNNTMICVKGSAGAQPPNELIPENNELVINKQYYSAFGSGELHSQLKEKEIDTLIVSGIYTHACIRQTALDAYERGYNVKVAEDGTGTIELLHAELTRAYLSKRGIEFISISEVSKQLNNNNIPSDHLETYTHTNPSANNEINFVVPATDRTTVETICENAQQAYLHWRQETVENKLNLISRWIACIELKRSEFVDLLVKDIGKPVREAHLEMDYTRAILQSVMDNYEQKEFVLGSEGKIVERRYSVGVISIITPWNNPVAIPAGKIAPALIYGNTVVWKPAQPAARITTLLMGTLQEAGLLSGAVNVVQGDAVTARQVISSAQVNAVTITGSVATGRQVAMLCSSLLKPVQAELGGNNAALVMADCDLGRVAKTLTKASYSFSGQRCTAPRRYLVEESVFDDFIACVTDEVSKLKIGHPQDGKTDIGPLISEMHRIDIKRQISDALTRGNHLIYKGDVPAKCDGGNWLAPSLILVDDESDPLFQNESFGPVVVVHKVRDIDDAIRSNNRVSQGLMATLFSNSLKSQEKFLDLAKAGILRINPESLAITPDYAFGGWGESGLGPPEHGKWDAEFYSRPQTIYS